MKNEDPYEYRVVRSISSKHNPSPFIFEKRYKRLKSAEQEYISGLNEAMVEPDPPSIYHYNYTTNYVTLERRPNSDWEGMQSWFKGDANEAKK